MKDLSKQQQLFSSAVQTHAGELSQEKLAELSILDQSPESFSADERLAVYQNAFIARTHESLTEDFQEVLSELGDEKFTLLLTEYLKAYPSNSWTLSELGARLPKFIADSHWNTTYPKLSKLAELEWFKVLSELAPVAPPFDFSKLATLSPDDFQKISFDLSESVFLMNSNDTYFLISAPNGTATVSEISALQFQILEKLKTGATTEQLMAVLEKLKYPIEEIETVLMGAFSEWVSNGIIVGFKNPAHE